MSRVSATKNPECCAYIQAVRNRALMFVDLRGILDRLEDGEVFDYDELDFYTQMFEQTHNLVCTYRKKMEFTGGYNFVDTINLQGCRVEEGKIIGTDCTRALEFAKKWLDDCPAFGEDCTLYELGTYLLYLTKK